MTGRTHQVRCRGWHDLQEGWVHCGVDAAFFVSSKHTGIGMILRDARGNFVAAKVLCLPGCLRFEEGEAIGIYEALSWIKQKGLHNALIKSDSKIAVDAIISRSGDVSELGTIVDNCRDILNLSPNIKVKHVLRDANMLAHRIAKSAKDFPNAYVWNEPPEFVEDLLHFPCSY